MDVPAPDGRQVLELKVAVGGKVSAGDALLVLAAERRAQPAAAAPASRSPRRGRRQRRAAAPSAKPAPRAAPRRRAAPCRARRRRSAKRMRARPCASSRASSASSSAACAARARRAASPPTTSKAFVKELMHGRRPGASALPAVPTVDFAKYGRVETEPLSRIQKISGPRLHASWVNIPHVTQHDEADITELEENARRSRSRRTSAASRSRRSRSSFVRAHVALAEMPQFKSSLSPDGESLVLKHYTHIGFAADTPNGLVVPVIRDADKKDLYEIASRFATLSERRTHGKLQSGRHSRRRLHDLELGQHRRAVLHADHQRTRGRDPRRLAQRVAAGLSRPRVRAAADVAVVALVRPSRHRRREGRALHDAALRDPRQSGAARRGDSVSRRRSADPRARGFSRRRRHRGPRQGRRHARGRRPARHARDGQGDDGRAGAARRDRRVRRDQEGRQSRRPAISCSRSTRPMSARPRSAREPAGCAAPRALQPRASARRPRRGGALRAAASAEVACGCAAGRQAPRGDRRRARRLHRGVPRGGPRSRGHARRTLADARRRLLERRLHPVESAAARRTRHRGSARDGLRTASRSASRRSTRQARRLEEQRRAPAHERPRDAREAAQGALSCAVRRGSRRRISSRSSATAPSSASISINASSPPAASRRRCRVCRTIRASSIRRARSS